MAQSAVIVALEAQNKISASQKTAIALSNAYLEHALWYQETPQFNFDSTFSYIQKSVRLLENTFPLPHENLIEAYRHLLDYRIRKFEFEPALEVAAIGNSLFEGLKDKKKINKLILYEFWYKSAIALLMSDTPKKGLDVMTKALDLLQDETEPKAMAAFYKGRGVFYEKYGQGTSWQLGLPLNDLMKAKAMYESFNRKEDLRALHEIYSNLMWYYNVKGIVDSCDLYFNKMNHNLQQIKDPVLESQYHILWGNTQSRRGNYTIAKTAIEKGRALMIDYRFDFSSNYQFSENLLGVVAQKEKKYSTALQHFENARGLGQQLKIAGSDQTYFFHLSDLNRDMGNYKDALKYFIVYSDSSVAYVAKRKDQSLRESELQLDVLSAEKEITRKKNQQIWLIVIFGIGLLLMGLLYKNFRTNKKNNNKLKVLNTELESKHVQLDKRNAENELLLKEIHHRVKNNLEIVSSLLELQSAQIEDPTVQSAMLSSQNRVHSMGIIHQKLYQGEHLAAIEMRDYFINLGENILSSFNAKGRVKIECNMPQLVLDVNTAISIGLITNELLTNSLKYAFVKDGKGKIEISLNEQIVTGDLLLKISDNGIGKSSTTKTQGTGFGTQLIQLLTKQLDGQLTYEVGIGTTVLLAFKR